MTLSEADKAIIAEALPCPFCGEQPTVEPTDQEVATLRAGNACDGVRCVNAKCAARPVVWDGIMVSDERGSHAYRRAAVKRWNRRAKQP